MDQFNPVSWDEYQRILGILRQNAGKTFVQRILRPGDFPSLDIGDGYTATHRMAWGQAGNKYVVFPTVLYDGNKLVDYGDKAFDQAYQSKNFIEFDNPQDAEWFSKRYKGAWGGKFNEPPK